MQKCKNVNQTAAIRFSLTYPLHDAIWRRKCKICTFRRCSKLSRAGLCLSADFSSFSRIPISLCPSISTRWSCFSAFFTKMPPGWSVLPPSLRGAPWRRALGRPRPIVKSTTRDLHFLPAPPGRGGQTWSIEQHCVLIEASASALEMQSTISAVFS